jgi:hypothetical protein
MTEFDFLSVPVSIIFGLALTHLLYTGWVFMVLVPNLAA